MWFKANWCQVIHSVVRCHNSDHNDVPWHHSSRCLVQSIREVPASFLFPLEAVIVFVINTQAGEGGNVDETEDSSVTPSGTTVLLTAPLPQPLSAFNHLAQPIKEGMVTHKILLLKNVPYLHLHLTNNSSSPWKRLDYKKICVQVQMIVVWCSYYRHTREFTQDLLKPTVRHLLRYTSSSWGRCKHTVQFLKFS